MGWLFGDTRQGHGRASSDSVLSGGVLAGVAAAAEGLEFAVWVAAEGDFVDVVGGEVCGRVCFASPSGAPVAVLCAVGVDCGFPSGAVAGLAGLAAELSFVAVVGAAMLAAARLVLQLRASG